MIINKVLIADVRLSENDVGSLPVQVVLLKQRIDSLKNHLNAHRGDMRSKAVFFKLLRQRKKLLVVLVRMYGKTYENLV